MVSPVFGRLCEESNGEELLDSSHRFQCKLGAEQGLCEGGFLNIKNQHVKNTDLTKLKRTNKEKKHDTNTVFVLSMYIVCAWNFPTYLVTWPELDQRRLGGHGETRNGAAKTHKRLFERGRLEEQNLQTHQEDVQAVFPAEKLLSLFCAVSG